MTLAALKDDFDHKIGKEYGLVLDFPPPKEGHWSGLTDEDVDFVSRQLAMVEQQLREYPVKLIRESKWRNLHLVGSASFSGRASGKLMILGRTTSVRIFHHELWHILDSSYEPWMATSREPVEWVNVKAFTYGQPWPSLKGFASKYATTAENEDQAETAAYIWVNGGNIYERIKHDHILRRKVVTVIKWYSSHGITKFDYLTTSWWKLKR